MSKDTRNALILYASLLTAALLIFFKGPFDRTLMPGDASTESSDSLTLPQIESHEDLDKLVDFDPAVVDNTNLPITPTESLHTTIPERVDVNINEYSLIIDGLVRNPVELKYEQVLDYPQTSEVVLLICPGFFVDNADWTGVRLGDLLTGVDVMPEATIITFYGIDVSYERKYSRTFPIDIVSQQGVLVAYQVNGEVLPPEHGYPLRLVLEGYKGFDWVKWIDHIEIS
jgi:DMSO/TMAO reductase YedYZ molybdopterin-dependent catalytic subunit